jgi:hypothetical protein
MKSRSRLATKATIQRAGASGRSAAAAAIAFIAVHFKPKCGSDQSRADDRQSLQQGAGKPPGSVAKARAFAGSRLQWSSSGSTFVEIRGALSMNSLLVVVNGIAIVCRSIVGNNMNREIVIMIASVLAAPCVSFDELGRAIARRHRRSALPRFLENGECGGGFGR